jgi:hypothetical protein
MRPATPIPHRQPTEAIAPTRQWPRVGILLAAAILLPACMSLEQIAPPVATLAAPPEWTSSLEQGRLIYLQTCSRCHAAPHILEYTPAEWDTILPDMFDESDLAGPHRRLVTSYVTLVLQRTSSAPLDSRITTSAPGT